MVRQLGCRICRGSGGSDNGADTRHSDQRYRNAGLDGYDLIRQVRGLPAGKGGKVPAIALTAYTRIEDRLQALRAGYDMHVPKPVELAELVRSGGERARRRMVELTSKI